MKEIKVRLTKKSSDELMKWHASRGIMFLSDGSGKSYSILDVGFLHTKNGYFLQMGNKKAIKLTDEQANVIGCFAIEDTEE